MGMSVVYSFSLHANIVTGVHYHDLDLQLLVQLYLWSFELDYSRRSLRHENPIQGCVDCLHGQFRFQYYDCRSNLHVDWFVRTNR